MYSVTTKSTKNIHQQTNCWSNLIQDIYFKATKTKTLKQKM